MDLHVVSVFLSPGVVPRHGQPGSVCFQDIQWIPKGEIIPVTYFPHTGQRSRSATEWHHTSRDSGTRTRILIILTLKYHSWVFQALLLSIIEGHAERLSRARGQILNKNRASISTELFFFFLTVFQYCSYLQ